MPQRSHRILAALLYSALFFVGGLACGRSTPALIAVTELTPARVEPRDILVVKGDGFVAGGKAKVRFKGHVHEPGAAPRHVDWSTAGDAVDQETVEVIVSQAMVSALGSSDDNFEPPSHVTFQGEVEVGFAPRVAGAPPIVGRASEIVLDVFRGLHDTAPTPTEHPALEWLGLEVRERGASGLEVVAVVPELPAAQAGILAGDVLRSWSKVRVHSRADIEPYPGQKLAEVTLQRKGVAGTMALSVVVSGYAPLGASGWSFGLVLLSVLMCALLLTRTPLTRWLEWLVMNGRHRNLSQPNPERSAALVPFILVSALYLALAQRQRLMPFELDVAGLALLTSLTAACSCISGAYRGRTWSLRALLGHWWRQVPFHVALWAIVGVLILERGSASVWELAQPQTLDPRSMGVFVSPIGLLLTGALLVSLSSLWLGRYRASTFEPHKANKLLEGLAASCGDLCVLLLAGLVVSVFAGGWASSAQAATRVGLLEAASFQLRLTALYALLVWLRRAVPAPPMQVVQKWHWRLACPMVGGAMLLMPIWWAEVWPTWLRQGVQNAMMSVSAVVVLGVAAALVLLRRRSVRLRLGLNPWL